MDIPQERKLVTEVPGPKGRELLARRESAIPLGVANITPITTARANGAIVEDVDGNRFIDFATGIAVLNVGHTSPAVVAAAQRQTDLETHTSFHVTMNEPYIELAERLNDITPGAFAKKTMFANSGAEAVENAVKIARYHTGRDGVVVFDHSFHGRTLLAMSMTAKVMPYKQGFGPFAPEIYRLPFAYPYRCTMGTPGTCTAEGCSMACAAYAIDEMEKHIGPDNIACIVVEPIQGEGGFVVPSPGFIPALKEFCERHDILFVSDEIQTGIGRTGKWFAIEHEGVVPDILTIAKSLGGGFPISAVTGRAEVMDAAHVGGLGGTYGGNPVAAAASLAVPDQIDHEALLDRAERLGDLAFDRLLAMQTRHRAIGDVRGRGLMVAMELVADRGTKEPADKAVGNAILKHAWENGLIVLKAGTYDNVIRLLPPLTIDESLLKEGLDILDEAIAASA